ncbi:MAG: hypothetical protein H6707_15525 [Deltaproteobacteria bacterium]|nr:hypothetical protein [Deltaproteobacteria bacterium]
MIVVAIIATLMSTALLSFRSVTNAELRSAATKTSALFRAAFNRATMTGEMIRVAIDLDKNVLWIERSEDRVSLRRGRTQHDTTDENEAGPKEEDADAPPGGGLLGLGGPSKTSTDEAGGEEEGAGTLGIDTDALKQAYERDLAPPKRRKALFAPISRHKRPSRRLHLANKVGTLGVAVPRLDKPVSSGLIHIYFFPQGHAEPAVVQFCERGSDGRCRLDESGAFYSVLLHPLTGRAKVKPCIAPIPEEFGPVARASRNKRDAHACVEPK